MGSETDARAVQADSSEVDRVLNRLRRVEGQVRGLQRMVEEGQDCEAILTQLAAARSALDRVGIHLISHQMRECIGRSSDPAAEEAELEQAFEMFLRYRQGVGDDDASHVERPPRAESDEVQHVLQRLANIEERVRGVRDIVEAGTECELALTRLALVKSALDQVGIRLISHRMRECVDRGEAAIGLDPIERALGVFLKYAASAR